VWQWATDLSPRGEKSRLQESTLAGEEIKPEYTE